MLHVCTTLHEYRQERYYGLEDLALNLRESRYVSSNLDNLNPFDQLQLLKHYDKHRVWVFSYYCSVYHEF